MAADFFKKFVKDLGDPDTSIASDGLSASEFSGYIDSGSYTLNAAVSGTIYGGFPKNKASLLAGEPATGKTFYALGQVRSFLESDKKARVFYFDTESAVTNEMMTSRGIDISRVAKSEPDCLETFRNLAYKLLQKYKELPEGDRFPLLIVLDSLSMLPSKKEINDAAEEKDTRDMTKAGVIKGIFRVLRLELSKLNVALIVTNHVYALVGAYVPTKVVAGGSGAQYAADVIVMLSKKKEKDKDGDLIGNIVTATMAKSRLTREGTKVETRILFAGGLDRYYGLLEPALEAGIVKKDGNKYAFPNGEKGFEKNVQDNPEKFWTKDVLDQMDAYFGQQFKYLGTVEPTEADDDGDE